MADRLTQLQDCLDDLALQMYASLRYINSHHPFTDIPGQPSQAPQPPSLAADGTTTTTTNNNNEDNGPPTAALASATADVIPDDAKTFQASLRELARDLVLKEQQTEVLIRSLPGIGESEERQRGRIGRLEEELRTVERERAGAGTRRGEMKAGIEGVLRGVRRVY